MRNEYVFVLLTSFVFALSCSIRSKVSDTAKWASEIEAVMIYEEDGINFGPCEPSIAINPIDPREIVAGSVLRFVHRSRDRGRTWRTSVLESPLGVYGDPCIVVDASGKFYYLHLGDPEGTGWSSERFLESIVVQKSSNAGEKWSDGVAIGPNPPHQQDKEWAVVNPVDNSLGVSWTEFDEYGSKSDSCYSRILFSRSNDFAENWSEPVVISNLEGNCEDDDETPEGAVPAADKDGNFYISWAHNNKIFFDFSTNSGKSWQGKDRVIARQESGWAMEIPGLERCNGMPVTCVDISDSRYAGNIYVVYADQKANGEDTDIFLIVSEDRGKNWTDPVNVFPEDGDKHQFLPWMDVDPKTGNIFIVFYDRSAHEDLKTDVRLAISEDGGQSFESVVVSDSSFVPPGPLKFFGDYNNIAAYDGMVRPIWTAYYDGKLSVWTALVQSD